MADNTQPPPVDISDLPPPDQSVIPASGPNDGMLTTTPSPVDISDLPPPDQSYSPAMAEARKGLSIDPAIADFEHAHPFLTAAATLPFGGEVGAIKGLTSKFVAGVPEEAGGVLWPTPTTVKVGTVGESLGNIGGNIASGLGGIAKWVGGNIGQVAKKLGTGMLYGSGIGFEQEIQNMAKQTYEKYNQQ